MLRGTLLHGRRHDDFALDASPLRIGGPVIVERRFLRLGARQARRQRAHVAELVPPGIELRAVPVPRHRHIGQVPVHRAGGEHIGAVHRRPLGLVNGGGVAVVHRRVVGHGNRYGPPLAWSLGGIQPHTKAAVLGLLHGRQHPVLHAQLAVVLAEQQPVTRRKGALALGRPVNPLVRQLAPLASNGPDRLVEVLHVRVAMRQHQARTIRPRLHVGRHVAHNRGPRVLARLFQPHRAPLGIGGQPLGRAVPAKIH